MPVLHNAHAGDPTFVLFPSTLLSLHHSSPLQVIPKQNLSVHEPLRPGILAASSRPALLSRGPSFSPKSPPLCPPSPRLKRCSSIFNGAIVLLCLSEWGSIGWESVLYLWAGLAWIGEGVNSNSWEAGRRCGGDRPPHMQGRHHGDAQMRDSWNKSSTLWHQVIQSRSTLYAATMLTKVMCI